MENVSALFDKFGLLSWIGKTGMERYTQGFLVFQLCVVCSLKHSTVDRSVLLFSRGSPWKIGPCNLSLVFLMQSCAVGEHLCELNPLESKCWYLSLDPGKHLQILLMCC